MEIFDIIVGLFSIIGSVFGIISAFALISINNKISIDGSNNIFKTTIQNNKGKDNENVIKLE